MKSTLSAMLPLVAALTLLLVFAQKSIGPVALMLAVWVLLWPLRRTSLGRTIRLLLVLVIAFWILHQARWVVYSFVGGLLLAYILLPLVEWIGERRVQRSLASLLSLIPLVLLIGLTLVLLVPALIQQISTVVSKLPDIYAMITDRIGPLLAKTGTRPVTVPLAPEQAPGQPLWLQELMKHAEMILKTAAGGVLGVTKGLGKALQWAGALLLIPITAYYLLVDWDRIGRGLLTWIPPRHHAPARRISNEVQTALTVYVRGQAKVAAIEAVLFSVAFSLAGLDQPIALGVLGGILSLVPVLGFWITALLVTLASLTGAEPWGTLLKAAIGLLAINVLESQVLVPKVQGTGLGLHPLAVFLGVLLFGTLFGVFGVLLAAPAMAVIKALLPEIRESWRRSRHFGAQIASGTGDEPPR